MNYLEFDIYIGIKKSPHQSSRFLAEVSARFPIPKSELNRDGTEYLPQGIYFQRLETLGYYFADWIDLVENQARIRATVYLNILSNKKTFTGIEILRIIDQLQRGSDLSKIRSFKEINC